MTKCVQSGQFVEKMSRTSALGQLNCPLGWIIGPTNYFCSISPKWCRMVPIYLFFLGGIWRDQFIWEGFGYRFWMWCKQLVVRQITAKADVSLPNEKIKAVPEDRRKKKFALRTDSVKLHLGLPLSRCLQSQFWGSPWLWWWQSLIGLCYCRPLAYTAYNLLLNSLLHGWFCWFKQKQGYKISTNCNLTLPLSFI